MATMDLAKYYVPFLVTSLVTTNVKGIVVLPTYARYYHNSSDGNCSTMMSQIPTISIVPSSLNYSEQYPREWVNRTTNYTDDFILPTDPDELAELLSTLSSQIPNSTPILVTLDSKTISSNTIAQSKYNSSPKTTQIQTTNFDFVNYSSSTFSQKLSTLSPRILKSMPIIQVEHNSITSSSAAIPQTEYDASTTTTEISTTDINLVNYSLSTFNQQNDHISLKATQTPFAELFTTVPMLNNETQLASMESSSIAHINENSNSIVNSELSNSSVATKKLSQLVKLISSGINVAAILEKPFVSNISKIKQDPSPSYSTNDAEMNKPITSKTSNISTKHYSSPQNSTNKNKATFAIPNNPKTESFFGIKQLFLALTMPRITGTPQNSILPSLSTNKDIDLPTSTLSTQTDSPGDDTPILEEQVGDIQQTNGRKFPHMDLTSLEKEMQAILASRLPLGIDADLLDLWNAPYLQRLQHVNHEMVDEILQTDIKAPPKETECPMEYNEIIHMNLRRMLGLLLISLPQSLKELEEAMWDPDLENYFFRPQEKNIFDVKTCRECYTKDSMGTCREIFFCKNGATPGAGPRLTQQQILMMLQKG